MNANDRIYVAGGGTLIGSALLDLLPRLGFANLVGVPPDEPDLTSAGQVEDFFAEARPHHVFMPGGKSGGIGANLARPAELLLDNLLSTAHVLDAAHRHGVHKLVYLASSCAYPREAPQPLQPSRLMTGALEATSAAYATGKLAGWQLCTAYRRQYGARFVTAIPANAFGPHDDFGPETGHVIPALFQRLYAAIANGLDEVVLWGTGKAVREFVYAPDLAEACVFVMENYEDEAPINLGSGTELTIAELARLVASAVGYGGRISFDPARPDGAPRKCLDSRPLRQLGWRPRTPMETALTETYQWFLQHLAREGAMHECTSV